MTEQTIFDALRGKTVFLTGGTGFIGSHLAEYLLEAGCSSVRCLVRTEPKWLSGLPVEFVAGDLTDRSALERGVRGADFIFHAAARTRARSWKAFESANVDGTNRLLDVVSSVNPNIERLVLTSSLAVVGNVDTRIADEITEANPVSLYGQSKWLMEQEAWEYSDRLPITVVRPPAVYGPRETDIFTFFKIMKMGLCPVVGDGRRDSVSLVHIDDLVRGVAAAAIAPNASGSTYFLGPSSHSSWYDVRNIARDVLGRPVLTIPVPKNLVRSVGTIVEFVASPFGVYPPFNRDKAAEITEACLMCDSSKAERDFGYHPRVDLARGIQRTIAWYRDEGWL